MSFGTYPEVSLVDARVRRDEARASVAKDIDPRAERRRRWQAAVAADEHTFMAVYERWLNYRKPSLDVGRQCSLEQIPRVFNKNVFPKLRRLMIHEITTTHLLDIIGVVEKRGAFSVAEKLRTWFGQLFGYARIVVPGMKENPAADLDVVAIPLPPVDHNPFLRMGELPAMLPAAKFALPRAPAKCIFAQRRRRRLIQRVVAQHTRRRAVAQRHDHPQRHHASLVPPNQLLTPSTIQGRLDFSRCPYGSEIGFRWLEITSA